MLFNSLLLSLLGKGIPRKPLVLATSRAGHPSEKYLNPSEKYFFPSEKYLTRPYKKTTKDYSEVVSFFLLLAIVVYALPTNAILSCQDGDLLSVGYPLSYDDYLLIRDHSLPATVLVAVLLTSKGYSFPLPFQYQLSLKGGDCSEDGELEFLELVLRARFKTHILLVEEHAYSTGKQSLNEVE